MKKWITGAVAAAALVAAGISVLPAAEATAQVPGILTLVEGPGSSIGVTVRDTTDEERKRANVDQGGGVVVESVRAGSPAERAGFRAGDIVLEFDGERVRSVRQFTRLVRETPPQRTARAVVVRDTARQTLEVVPEASGDFRVMRERLRQFGDDARDGRYFFREFDFDVAPRLRSRGPALGVTVSPLTGQLAEYFGVKEGVLVNSVESGSAAAAAGLRAGDVITAVGGRSVRTAADISDEVRRLQPGASVDVTITRDKKSQTLTAVIPSAQAPASQGRGITL